MKLFADVYRCSVSLAAVRVRGRSVWRKLTLAAALVIAGTLMTSTAQAQLWGGGHMSFNGPQWVDYGPSRQWCADGYAYIDGHCIADFQPAWLQNCKSGYSLSYIDGRWECIRDRWQQQPMWWDIIKPAEEPASEPDPVPETEPYVAGGETVLLVHGINIVGGFRGINTDSLPVDPIFYLDWLATVVAPVAGDGILQATDCNNYWAEQRDYYMDANPAGEVVTIGFYSDDTGCNVNVDTERDNSIYTSITTIAEELYVYIRTHYAEHNQAVDIVAHSMGGIIVRKMLEDWGHEIMVDEVVTLGTPHGGHNSISGWLYCPPLPGVIPNPVQCEQTKAGSSYMESLEQNPQSADTPTSWTLIATDADTTVGAGTGTDMEQGDDPNAPNVSRYTYRDRHQFDCGWGWFKVGAESIGHGSLHGSDGVRDVINCNNGNTVAGPTERAFDAIH